MSDTTDDLYNRLGAAIENWNFQIVQSHEALAKQIQAARGHLERLAEPDSELESPDRAPAPHTGEDVAALEAELAQLRAELAAIYAGGGPAGEEPVKPGDASAADAETALAAAKRALDESEAARDTLEMELDARKEELEQLRGQLTALEADHERAQKRIDDLESAAKPGGLPGAAPAHEQGGTVLIEAFDAQGHKKRMGEILMELGVLDEAQLKAILKEQSADPQHRLGALVIEHGFTGEDIVAKILAAQLRLPYLDIENRAIEPRVVELVSPHVTQLHRCVPLTEVNGVLTVSMVNPLDLIAIEDLELASGCQVSPAVSTPAQIKARLDELYGEAE